MKKRVSLMIIAMVVLGMMAAGCGAKEPEPVPSPSPMIVSPSPAATPEAEMTPDVQQPPMAGGVIQNFVEGAVIEIANLPAEIAEAVRKEYSDATVKSASYATYENQQMYRITLQQGENDATEDVYVTADGKIIPAKATAASPSPDMESKTGPANGVESGK